MLVKNGSTDQLFALSFLTSPHLIHFLSTLRSASQTSQLENPEIDLLELPKFLNNLLDKPQLLQKPDTPFDHSEFEEMRRLLFMLPFEDQKLRKFSSED